MKTLEYKMKVKNTGDRNATAWEEPIKVEVDDSVSASDHAKQLIKGFNASRRPGERSRELVSIEEVSEPTLEVGDKVTVINPCPGSGNKKGKKGTVQAIDDEGRYFVGTKVQFGLKMNCWEPITSLRKR